MTDITADDKLIWDCPTGTTLMCIKSVVMSDDQSVAFTAGQKYVVDSMHPIAEPAYIRLTNDRGEEHKMSGAHVGEYFKR